MRELAERRGLCLRAQTFHRGIGKVWLFRRRFGLLLGLLLAAGVIFYQSNVVETIEITGAQTADERVILALLEDEGIRRGTWIGDIDMFRAEQRVRTSLPEVAWAGMHRIGNRIVLDISEFRQNVPMLHERIPCNILAAHDAQITGAEVYSGAFCHRIGDGVRKGELLVSGVRTEESGKSVFLHANAHITGIFTQEAELSVYTSQTVQHPTGRRFTRRLLRVFGLRIPLTAGRAPFAAARTRNAEIPLVFAGFTLPCSILTETAEELETQDITLTPEEGRLALNGEIVRYEKNLLSGVKILARDIGYAETDGCMTAHLTYRLEGEIGETSEIFMLSPDAGAPLPAG